LKHWKLTDFDIIGLTKCEGYNIRKTSFASPIPDAAPWTVRAGERQRRLTLNAMRFVLTCINYTARIFLSPRHQSH
jgi:polyphosphate kinase 2 (PPK2 family)